MLRRAWAPFLVLVVVIAFHQFDPDHWTSLARRILHSLHGPGFAVLAAVTFWMLRGRYDGWIRVAVAWGLCTVISLAAELSQVPGPRNAEFSDLVVDNIGILAGLTVSAAIQPPTGLLGNAVRRWHIAALAFVLTIAVMAPTAWLIAAFVHRGQQLPLLLSFESLLDREYYIGMHSTPPARADSPENWPASGNTIGLGTADGKWGTLIAIDPHPDWRAFDAVSFFAANARDEPASVGVTIHGLDNYYQVFEVGSTPTRLVVRFDDIRTAAPRFDFASVRTVVVSAANPDEDLSLYLDDFRLETQDSR